ncbi:chaperonin 10-like protein [Phlebopus sp. FC_14]|nr:chaperonin 10-like protein [Phlebopus sp. FC_14]
MTTQKALWLKKVFGEFTLGTNPVPHPGTGEVLVKLEASALNPADWKVQKFGLQLVKKYPAVIGADGAGVVEQVGEGVNNFVKGDKIFFQSSFETDYATFQQYCLAAADVAAKIPDNISFDEAASVSSGIMAPAVAFYGQRPHGFAIAPPFEQGGIGKYSDQPFVVMGGASSLGQYAIQLAKLSGFSPIITTASLHNKDLLLSLGATHVIDRNLPATALHEEVAKITSTPVSFAFDAVSLGDTQQVAYDLLAPGGQLALVLASQIKEQERSGKLVVKVFGSFHPPYNRLLGVQFMEALSNWLAEGKVKPNVVEVLAGGLDGVANGLKRLENNAVSGRKLVVRPFETV